ncbi:hypothetical protein [Chryseobacterium sp.]|uniref:hypothetical protein n=1 Tax=Chryseobacterium sp. TaxID=1871047 RepID=UPI0026179692|nr:hypothetical protein [Chryseobacterium sp.]
MKKIYYVPGLISAVLIPILFWYYGNQRVHPQYTVMDLGLPSKVRTGQSLLNTFEPYRKWNYKKIMVQPNTALQNRELYISELKELQAKNVKESGIEFILNDKNTYQDFIALMNAMEMSKQEAFCLDMEKTGHFFAVHFYKDSNNKERDYYGGGCVVYGDHVRKNKFDYRDLDNLVKHLPMQSHYMIFGFLIFLNIFMLSIKERFQM